MKTSCWFRLLWCSLLTWSVMAVLGSAAGMYVRVDPPPPAVVPHVLSIPEMIVEESSRAGVSAHLPLAVAWRESRMTNVLSKTFDSGPMQINLPTAQRAGLDVTALLDARNSTAVGIQWLMDWQSRCGSPGAAVWAFAHGRCEADAHREYLRYLEARHE